MKPVVNGLRANREWRRLWLANAIGGGASAMASFLSPLILMGMTHSLSRTGIVVTMASITTLMVLLPSGYLADAVNRRVLLLLASYGTAISYVVAAVSWSVARSWLVVAVCLVSASVLGTLAGPAGDAALKSIVDAKSLASAKVLNQLRGYTLRLLMPVVGAACLANFGLVTTFGVLAGIRLLETLCLLRVTKKLGPQDDDDEHHASSMKSTFAIVWRPGVVRSFLLFASFSNVASITVTTLVTLRLAHSGHAASSVSLLAVTMSVTSIIGGLMGLRLLRLIRPRTLLVASSTVQMICFVGVAISGVAPVPTVAFMALSRLLIPAANAGMAGLVAGIVPNSVQGRLSAAVSFGAVALQPLGVAAGSYFALSSRAEVAGLLAAVFVIVCATVPLARARELGAASLPA